MKKLSSKWAKLGQMLWYFLSRELGMTVVENSENISLSVCTHMRIGMPLECVSAYSIAFCLYTLNWRTRITKEKLNWLFFWIRLLSDSFPHKLFICSSPLDHNLLTSLEMQWLYLAWQGSGLKGSSCKVRKRHQLYKLVNNYSQRCIQSIPLMISGN